MSQNNIYIKARIQVIYAAKAAIADPVVRGGGARSMFPPPVFSPL